MIFEHTKPHLIDRIMSGIDRLITAIVWTVAIIGCCIFWGSVIIWMGTI